MRFCTSGDPANNTVYQRTTKVLTFLGWCERSGFIDHNPGARHFTRAGGVMKGDLIYRLLSGIAHAAAHGLRSGYDPLRDGLFPTGMGGAQFPTTGPDVLIVLGVVTLSYVNALDQVAELYGWKDEPWDAARLRALQTGKSHFPTS